MSSRRRVRRRECTRKRAYSSEEEARRVVRSFRRSLPAYDGRWLYPYRCPWCRQWHIGNRPGKYRPRLRGRPDVALK